MSDQPEANGPQMSQEELMKQLEAARRQQLTAIMQTAGEAMERMRMSESGIFNVNSSESKIYRAGMAAASLSAAERIGNATFQACTTRTDDMIKSLVDQLENVFQTQVAPLQARVKELEEVVAKLRERE
jgi:polyhydroxyalkanoate synthesis regulator phasin